MQIEQVARYQGYQILGVLGQGTFGKVKLGKKNDELVAIKFLSNKISTKVFNTNKQLLLKEINLLKNLNHPNLVRYISSNISGIYERKNGKQYERLGMIIEYLPSFQLYQILRYGPLSEDLSRTYFHQLIDGLDELHKNSIIHRDLKPENLLFDENLTLKITDFGLAKLVQNNPPTTICGTSGYKSPEMNLKITYNGILNDLFAAGVILFNLVTGKSPFLTADPKAGLYKYIATNQYQKFWSEYDKKVQLSQSLKQLITSMLAFDPTYRLTIADIRNHEWYKKDTLMGEDLQIEVTNRIEKVRAKKLAEKKIRKLNLKQQNTGNRVVFGQKAFRSIEKMDMKVQQVNQKKKFNNYIRKSTDIFVNSIKDIKKFCDTFSIICTEVRIILQQYPKIIIKKVYQNEVILIDLQILQVDYKTDCLRFVKKQGALQKFMDFLKQINAIFQEQSQN